MTEGMNNLPPLPTAAELDAQVDGTDFLRADKWMDEDVEQDFLDFTKPYSPPRYTLERNGIPFANIGELHVVSGKPGNGKTGLMSQFMATILSGKQGNTKYREGMKESVILYVDTEQGEDDTIAIKNRVCSMAGIPYDKPMQRFRILRLRDTEEAVERWRKILKAVWLVTKGMTEEQCLHIFLDGLLDIVEDYNDQKECQPVIRKCMMLATHYDTSMWLVLHENPLVDKLVGTLGSITQRKVSEIFTVRKHKQSEEKPSERRTDRPEIYFTVQQLKARGRDVGNWDFEVTPENGWGMPRELNDTPAAQEFKTKHTVNELKQWIIEGQSRLSWPVKQIDFIAQIIKPNGVTDEDEQKELLQMALNRDFIRKQEKSEMKKGQVTPRLKLNGYVIPPFAEPTDEVPPF
jgi:hypothetical protein